LGIDEVSRAKGQRYLTLVYDLERHRLVWAGEGRTRDTIDGFFRWLGRRRGRSVQVVCCDMWDPYVEAVQTHLPHAQLVFDRFHIVQHLNRAVSISRSSAPTSSRKSSSASGNTCARGRRPAISRTASPERCARASSR